MTNSRIAAWAALFLAVPCLADGVPDPGQVEASFDGARLADDLSGTIADTSKETRIRVYASRGTKISATLQADVTGKPTVEPPALTLCDDAGTDLAVGGSPSDKTVPGSFVTTWKKFPLPSTGGFVFVLRGATAGSWRLKLGGTLAAVTETFTSPADLPVSAETQVDFHGLRGAKLAYQLTTPSGSKFEGALVRVERPDGTAIDETPTSAKGKLVLDADGVHHLVFRNAGDGIGPWKAKTTVTPSALVKRRGYVRPQGTALLPVVTSVTPSRDYQRNDASEVTLAGRDFQPGADVRLVRSGFEDIIGTDVVVESETEIRCTLDLDTAPITGKDSLGTWKVGVWNAPVYDTPGDPKTLVKASPTSDQKKPFECIAASSITLPPGTVKDTEVWQLLFNSEFQTDLDKMGLGSNDQQVRDSARGSVQAYVVCFLRDLMRQNETNGKLVKSTSAPVSFVVGKVPNAAGKPGIDYNRIEIGGAWETGDETDPGDHVLWGFAPFDAGNTHRDDLLVEIEDGLTGTTRVGHGARTRVLDPGAPNASPTWVTVTAPLRQSPLGVQDRRYFARGFSPVNLADANRYRDIVALVTRAAREIAAIVAHHVGRATGLASGGSGPMANPDVAGGMWLVNAGLSFASTDIATLRTIAVPHQLPGKSKTLSITYFPFLSTQPTNLPDATAAVDYAANWNFVGGRANALPSDYAIKVNSQIPILGNLPLRGNGSANYSGFTLTGSPVYIDAGAGIPYGGIAFIRLIATDVPRATSVVTFYRLNVYPNFNMLPSSGIVFNRATDIQRYIQNN